jgi:hypothetical protein
MEHNRMLILLAAISVLLILWLGFYYATRFDRIITIRKKRIIYKLEDTEGRDYDIHILQFSIRKNWDSIEVGKTYHIRGYGLSTPVSYASITYIQGV